MSAQKKQKKKSKFHLLHDALNFPSPSKAEISSKMMNTNSQQQVLLILDELFTSPSTHTFNRDSFIIALCIQHGITLQEANNILPFIHQYHEEKQIYDEVKKNRAKFTPCKNSNKNNCNVAVRLVKMGIPSRIIRKRLIEAGFLSNDHPLTFDPGFSGPYSEFDNSFTLIPFSTFWLSEAFTSWGDFKSCIGTKQFDCKLIVDVYVPNRVFRQSFWIKIVADQAIIKAGNGSQITHCMTVSNGYKIKISNDIYMNLTTVKGILGVGYCNLITDPRRKTKPKTVDIDGKSMIWIHEDHYIQASFYGNAYMQLQVRNIIVRLESKNLKKNKLQNPYELFDQILAMHMEKQHQQYDNNHNNSDMLMNEPQNQRKRNLSTMLNIVNVYDAELADSDVANGEQYTNDADNPSKKRRLQ